MKKTFLTILIFFLTVTAVSAGNFTVQQILNQVRVDENGDAITVIESEQQAFNAVFDESADALRVAVGDRYEFIDIYASAMMPAATSGPTAVSHEWPTNDVNKEVLAFDAATDQIAHFGYTFPPAWDRSTIKVKFYWVPAASTCTPSTDDVVWGFAATAIGDGDTIDTTYGTAQTVTDTVLTGKDGAMHVSSASSALTVAGTPAVGDEVQFKVYRDADNATDDMDENGRLIKIRIQFKLTETQDAW